ncbi:MAG: LytR C-terminal domain-containing protein [Bacteroidota bacterium]
MKKFLDRISIPIGLTVKVLLLSIMGIVSLYLLYVLIDKVFINPPITAIVPIEKRRTVSDVYIQINIINATGIQGLAKKAMNFFRDRGFDVVEITTSDTLREHSFVIDHLSDTVSAQNVAHALGLPDSTVKHDYDTNLYLRASVVLGKDYQTLKPFTQ